MFVLLLPKLSTLNPQPNPSTRGGGAAPTFHAANCVSRSLHTFLTSPRATSCSPSASVRVPSQSHKIKDWGRMWREGGGGLPGRKSGRISLERGVCEQGRLSGLRGEGVPSRRRYLLVLPGGPGTPASDARSWCGGPGHTQEISAFCVIGRSFAHEQTAQRCRCAGWSRGPAPLPCKNALK